MKALSTRLAVVLAALAMQASAQAQVPVSVVPVRASYSTGSDYGRLPHYYGVNPNYYWYRARTAAESYARAVAARTYAQGQYNRLTAEAMVINTEAYRRAIENRELAAETYFAMRKANREARAAQRRPRPTAAELARLAEQAKPDRPTPNELNTTTGKISWPVLLRADEFAAFRTELEEAFTRRAANGEIVAKEHPTVSRTTKAMLEVLKQHVREVNPMNYTLARQFIESLAYEIRKPVS